MRMLSQADYMASWTLPLSHGDARLRNQTQEDPSSRLYARLPRCPGDPSEHNRALLETRFLHVARGYWFDMDPFYP